MAPLCYTCLAASALLFALPAAAIADDGGPPEARQHDAAATADDEGTRDAKQHNAAATALFQRGDFAAAARRYEQAYAARPMPVFLHNLGQCYRRLTGPAATQKALQYFERFLEADPMVPNRSEVEHEIARLRRQLAKQRRSAAPPPAIKSIGSTPPTGATPARPPRPQASRPFYQRWWFWTIVGAVAAGSITATLMATTGGDGWEPQGTVYGPQDFSEQRR